MLRWVPISWVVTGKGTLGDLLNYDSSHGFFTGNQHVTVKYPANCVAL